MQGQDLEEGLIATGCGYVHPLAISLDISYGDFRKEIFSKAVQTTLTSPYSKLPLETDS